MKIQVQIGDFVSTIEYPKGFRLPENFRLFETDRTGTDFQYTIRLTDTLPVPQGTVIARRPDLTVLQTETGESRVIGIRGLEMPYALYQETSADSAEIYFLKSSPYESSIDTVFNSLLALERKMLSQNGLIFHCAYIRYHGEAILFSAPSETGKSTQADLWERYRGSETINGDRALLQKIDGRWAARGWPVCGSSEICHNEDTPIRAIVMLRQGPENESGLLRPIQAFQEVYSQITVNSWSAGTVSKAMDLVGDLQSQVPIYYLTCNISEDAVKCLEGTIYQ